MKRYLLVLLALAPLLVPSEASARQPRHHGRHVLQHHGHHHSRHHVGRHYPPIRHRTYYRHRHHRHGSDELVIGVMGGLLGGIILDRVFSPPVVVRQPTADPYAAGYETGYERGREKERQRRYQEGYRRGYEEGLYPSRRGYD